MASTIRLDLSEFERRLAVLKRPHAPIVRALNRSADSGKTMAVRLISQDMGLKVSDVRPFVDVTKAHEGKLEATIHASAKRIPLIKFGAKGREPSMGIPGGVRARLRGGAGTYPRAFIATMPNGKRGVFERPRGGRRTQFTQLRGPSVWQSFQKHQGEAAERAQEQLAKNVAHEISYALGR